MTPTWQIERPDVSVERAIITGMIVSDRVLRTLALTYRPRYLTVDYARMVAKWCLEHLAAYDRAPGRDIQAIYEAHRRNGLDPNVSELIGRFLASISEEYEEGTFNADYLIRGQAGQYFKERSLTLLRDDLDGHLGQGNLLAAEEAVARYSAPDGSISVGYEPLRDMQLVRRAFEREDELFTLDGDLGRMLGPFHRGKAWGLVGSYKGGKSWMCYHIQDQALYRRLNVARFSFEMTELEETRRFIQSIAGMPADPPKDGRVWLPVWDCQANQDGSCRRQGRVNSRVLLEGDNKKPPFGQEPEGYRPCSICRGTPDWRLESWSEGYPVDQLTWRSAWRRAEAVARQLRGARFKFQYWPMRTAGIAEIRSTLQVWEHLEGFIPDVIVVDYPDIMRTKGSDRFAIVENRQEVAALAKQYNALEVFPLQAGSKQAVERKSKRATDIGESVQVLGDVDGTIVLDQSEEEYQAMRSRVKTTVRRDRRRVGQVAILQCLDLGQAVIDSAFYGGRE